MSTDDTYNGWTNRETWACHLHLSNDEGLYSMATEALEGKEAGWEAAEAMREFVENLLDEFGEIEGIAMMRDEVGSMWRVDWQEVADVFMRVNWQEVADAFMED
jgi:hypothetical protein